MRSRATPSSALYWRTMESMWHLQHGGGAGPRPGPRPAPPAGAEGCAERGWGRGGERGGAGAPGRGRRLSGRAPEGGAQSPGWPSPAFARRVSGFQFRGLRNWGWAGLGASGGQWQAPAEQQELRERGRGSSGEDAGGEEGSLKPAPSPGPDSAGALGGHDRRARRQVSAFSPAPLVWRGRGPPVSRQCSAQAPHPPVSVFASRVWATWH